MIKNFLLIITITCLSYEMSSQRSLKDYSYVEVPERFEFLSQEDQYQVNSLAAFLFNKYGFNAYLSSDLPNVKRCDGLQADVVSNSNFIWTKLVVVLSDCNGNEIYRSDEGKSKYKDYRKSYHQALREAFQSIEALGVKQKDTQVYEESEVEVELDSEKNTLNPSGTEINPQLVGEVDQSSELTVGTGVQAGSSGNLNLPSAKFTSYISKGRSYLLRKAGNAYLLYEETTSAPDGLLLIGTISREGNSMVYDSEEGERFVAIFSENHDLSLISEGKVMQLKVAD